MMSDDQAAIVPPRGTIFVVSGLYHSHRTMAQYSVYVIELSKKVYSQNNRFRAANPQYNGVLECLYVGMTSKSPKERFDQHVHGVLSKRGKDLSSSIVKKYGIYLRPSLYNHLEPMSRDQALRMEEQVALDLRRQRYAVWYN